jgi:hypothetical protein
MIPFSTCPRPAPTAELCPFHDGAATLDGFLAEIDPRDTALFDAALDLRSLCRARAEPEACAAQFFRVRRMLDSRHYLAFYRVRRWMSRFLRVEVRAHRAAPWLARALPLDGARLDEVINAALAAVADEGGIPATAHARFAFAPAD